MCWGCCRGMGQLLTRKVQARDMDAAMEVEELGGRQKEKSTSTICRKKMWNEDNKEGNQVLLEINVEERNAWTGNPIGF